ncbi:hypothetical protein [Desertivirga xinjiangensis]|uniref:hypothetical protein n=1 Tax=Desertivirga xinjiangensis TaxID=539206 RepID=UPI00210CF7EF|nr:hypothetical protein [Pedobacter xinjiangensis]
MKLNKFCPACIGALLLSVTACKKGSDDFLDKSELMPVTVTGFNGSSENLLVKVGGFDFAASLAPNNSFNQKNIYTFNTNEDKVKLTVNEETTGKLVLEQELKKADGAAKVNFLYMDGRISAMLEKPAVAADKISLIYMFQPTVTNYTEPVDIVAGKYFVTPQVFEELARASNVKPYEFCAPLTFSTFSTARQDYNGTMTSVLFSVRVYKAGTNIPYIDGTSYTWNALNSTAPKPAASAASSKLYIFSEAPAGNIMRFGNRLEL